MKTRWLAPVAIVAMWAFALAVYGRLPERVPVHWNLGGEVDGWGPRFPAAFLMPLVAMGTVALVAVLPWLDPRRRNFERFRDELRLITNVLVLFFAWLEAMSLGAALGWPIDVTAATLAGTGLLFVAVGNYLPRVRSNWWVGIRTPWTLDSDRVWRETHRVGGRCFVAGGLATVVAALLPHPVRPWLAIAALGLASLVPIVYSYLAWRRESAERAA